MWASISGGARRPEAHRHAQILQRAGDEPQQRRALQADVPGDVGGHLLPCDVQPHVVVHLRGDLREGVVPQFRVDEGPGGEDEVAQGAAGEIGPQVHRHHQGHRLFPPPALAALAHHQRLDEPGGQELGDGNAVAPGGGVDLVHRDEAHDDIQGVEGLRRAGVAVGRAGLEAAPGPGGGVAGIGVLPFLRVRGLRRVQNALGAGHLHPAQPQILRHQRFQKHQRTRAVRQCVEQLDGDARPVIEHPQQPVLGRKTDGLAGVGDVRLHVGHKGGVGIKIIPERPPPQPHLQAGKAGHHPPGGLTQALGVHRGVHHRRKAVDRRIIVPLDGGIDHARVVQPVPVLRGVCHSASPPSVSTLYCSTAAPRGQRLPAVFMLY